GSPHAGPRPPLCFCPRSCRRAPPTPLSPPAMKGGVPGKNAYRRIVVVTFSSRMLRFPRQQACVLAALQHPIAASILGSRTCNNLEGPVSCFWDCVDQTGRWQNEQDTGVGDLHSTGLRKSIRRRRNPSAGWIVNCTER